jgi:hypothetical protein
VRTKKDERRQTPGGGRGRQKKAKAEVEAVTRDAIVMAMERGYSGSARERLRYLVLLMLLNKRAGIRHAFRFIYT